jgi:hypothetical protein
MHEEQETQTPDTPVKPHVHVEAPVQPHSHVNTSVQPPIHVDAVKNNKTGVNGGDEDVYTRICKLIFFFNLIFFFFFNSNYMSVFIDKITTYDIIFLHNNAYMNLL